MLFQCKHCKHLFSDSADSDKGPLIHYCEAEALVRLCNQSHHHQTRIIIKTTPIIVAQIVRDSADKFPAINHEQDAFRGTDHLHWSSLTVNLMSWSPVQADPDGGARAQSCRFCKSAKQNLQAEPFLKNLQAVPCLKTLQAVPFCKTCLQGVTFLQFRNKCTLMDLNCTALHFNINNVYWKVKPYCNFKFTAQSSTSFRLRGAFTFIAKSSLSTFQRGLQP